MFAVLSLAGLAAAQNVSTSTVFEELFTTVSCSTPTTVSWGNQTVTASGPTTFTLSTVLASPTVEPNNQSTIWVAPNGGSTNTVGAFAGIAAAVAYLI